MRLILTNPAPIALCAYRHVLLMAIADPISHPPANLRLSAWKLKRAGGIVTKFTVTVSENRRNFWYFYGDYWSAYGLLT